MDAGSNPDLFPAADGEAPTLATLAARPASRQVRWALVAILLWHGGLALWMAVAHPGPAHYFYDERFNMENAIAIVRSGSFEPANGWYSMPSYLPQTALIGLGHRLHGVTGREDLRMYDADGLPLGPAFLAARLVGIVYGSLSLLLVFVIGRRLFAPATGAWAAFWLACSPWQIRTSVEFKPDALLLLTTLLAFVGVLRLLETPGLRRVAEAGFFFGLTVAAKLNGLFFGPTLAVATVAAAWLRPGWRGVESGGRKLAARVTGWGLLEGGLAAAVFLAATPFLGVMWHYLNRMDRFYGQKGGKTGFLGMLQSAALDLWTPNFFGPLLCILALIGVAVVVAGSLDRPVDPALRVGRALVVVSPLSYLAALAWRMQYYKGNNVVQVLPFLALLAATPLVAAGFRRWGEHPAKNRLAAIGLSALVAHGLWQSGHFSYLEHVPTGFERLIATMAKTLPLETPQIILFEGGYDEMPLYDSARPGPSHAVASMRWLDDLTQLPRAELDLADALIFRAGPADADRTAARATLRGRVPPEDDVSFLARPLAQRGGSYFLVRHRWTLVDQSELPCSPTADPALFYCRLPETWQAGDVGALHFAFPNKRIGAAHVAIGAEEVEPLLAVSYDRGGTGWEAITERFVVTTADAEVMVRFEKPIEGPLQDQIATRASRWRAPAHATLELPAPFPSAGSAPP